MRTIAAILIVLMLAVSAFAYDINRTSFPELRRPMVRKLVMVPDIGEFKTLKCDFHIHTVFSDGSVWPDARVLEAWLDGLDAISITDHIENHPRRPYMDTADDDSSYEVALPAAEARDILLIKGSEITRSMPHGHYNALFLTNSQALDVPDFYDAVEEAINQGAFVLWNHPGWVRQQPDETLWQGVPQELLERGWLHGVEVFNGSEWYPVSLQWCIEKDLTVFANTDIHGFTSQQYNLITGQRPMTLVFARERSIEAIREALFDGRTVAWFSDQLAGRAEYLEALYKASVTASAPHMVDSNEVRRITVSNDSDLTFVLEGAGDEWTGTARLEPRSANIISAPGTATSLPVKITNLHTNLHETLSSTLEIPAK